VRLPDLAGVGAVKPTDRDLSAFVVGLLLAALIVDATTGRVGSAVAVAALLAANVGFWLLAARREQRGPTFLAGCQTCGWESSPYASPQDALSAARAHVTLASHREAP
jgi:hypothetical protein